MPSKIPTPNLKRNTELAPGVNRHGRRSMYVRKGIWAVKKRNTAGPKKIEKAQPKVVKYGKKGESRTKSTRTRIHFPSEAIRTRLGTKNTKATKATLRKSFTPGTIVIILNGKCMGKKAVFLKQLESGHLLVAGPFKLNGVPVKHIDQRFVIATSTKVDLGANKFDNINDAYFAKKRQAKQKKGEATFFTEKKAEKKAHDPAKVEANKAVDGILLPIIKKTANLEAYLKTGFALTGSQRPHEMKF